MDRQCSSCGGFCKKSGCERENANLKKWVGLTDDEIFLLYRTVWNPDEEANEVPAFARAIETKLKEKNHAN